VAEFDHRDISESEVMHAMAQGAEADVGPKLGVETRG